MEFGVPFPPAWKMAMQIAVFFVMEDSWHYWMHRALHYGPLYKAIHKVHHYYSAPFGLAAEYASPIEVMILGMGIVGSPIIWVFITGDLHLLTMYVWIILRLFQAIDAHSGYDFPWSLHLRARTNFAPPATSMMASAMPPPAVSPGAPPAGPSIAPPPMQQIQPHPAPDVGGDPMSIDDGSADGRKAKRELSQSKRAAQNRAAQ
ncbi:hypothetical protein BN1708_017176, partial [Verticillium longisporum]